MSPVQLDSCSCFFGLIANFLIMTIIGAVVLVWYLLWMPFSTLRQIQKDADIIGNLRMEEIIDAAQHSQTNSRRSLIHRVLAGMEKELQVREAKEAAVSDEEPFETAEESDSTQELDEFVSRMMTLSFTIRKSIWIIFETRKMTILKENDNSFWQTHEN